MAKLDPTPYPMPDVTDWDSHVATYEGLVAIDAALPDSDYIGALVRWQIADGYAVYRVTSLAGSGTLQWVPFCDGYTVDPALIRGLRKQDIKDKVDAARYFARTFGRR